MATKTKREKTDPQKRVKITDYKSIKWVLNNINDEQLAAIDALPVDVERMFDWIAHLIDHGIDLKVSWDDWSKCYQLTITGNYEGFLNSGYAMSARSDDMSDGFKILYGKFEFLCNGDMSTMYEQQTKRARRG